ncbi:DUF6273 domain-containing protein [Paenibacillus sp. NEAU-GSW1]|uniref:glycan biosynthesis hexose transferase WsfD n=1 Tax=Paenibacillus sp. NEAU-GSW1 TaxID=2682486 RepID=UPI0012E12B99|nr:DUF6273 domain-containing protein [Paenibacillus sp. NEAU-GSW1]MUT68107.1 hypothetical protein [Paenibacillus sp. NEAU-GSW1]
MLTLFLFIAAAIFLLIYVPTPIGLADNSDFDRTIRAFDLTPIHHLKYLTMKDTYHISNPARISHYFIRIFLPVQDNPAKYYSTQFIFIKIALFFNAIANKLLGRDRTLFNLSFQTAQYILFYAAALFLFIKENWKRRRVEDIAVKIAFAFIFMDCGYLVYFHSFYGESTTLIFLLLSFVLLLYLGNNNSSYLVYAGLLLSLFMFSGSKPANFPSALLLSVPIAYYAITHERLKKKIIVCTSIVVMLLASFQYAIQAPEWMEKATTFQSVFFGVLYNNPAPEQSTKELGLPPELSKLESINAYARAPLNPYDIYDSKFEQLFFDRTSKINVLNYYVSHPAFFAEKLDVSAEAALPLRPTYLTNVELSREQADLRFEFRLNVWESVRKHFSGFAAIFIAVVFALSLVNIIIKIRKKNSLYTILLRFALLGAAAGQFIVPIVSNGNADLQKHMFLFNVHLDMLIIVLLLDNLQFKNRTFRAVGFTAVAILAVLSFYQGKPETMTVGNIQGNPIKWIVIEKKDGMIKVIAEDVLFRSAFDEGSNDYAQASIRQQLNARLGIWFTRDERERIQKAQYPSYCNEENWRNAASGDRPLYWFSPIKYASQNSERAYRNHYTDYLTLPTLEDVEQLFHSSKTSAVLTTDYWLSLPYYGSTDKARIVSSDYQAYHRKVDTKLGIRPVMWISEK